MVSSPNTLLEHASAVSWLLPRLYVDVDCSIYSTSHAWRFVGLLESTYSCVDTYVTALYWSVARSQRHTPIVIISRKFWYICFYVRSFTTMTTVGYGDVNPVSNVEKIFAMFAMMV